MANRNMSPGRRSAKSRPTPSSSNPDTPKVIYSYVAGGESGAVSVENKIIGVMYMAASEMRELLTCARLNLWRGFVSLSEYSATEEFDYVGSGVGDQEICPES